MKTRDESKKKAKKKPRGKSLTSARASKLSREYWQSHRSIPTATTRIHKDALELGKAAWRDASVRINEESEAIRQRARRALKLS